MVRSEGSTSLKNPVTLPGIDPGTVRLVAQRLNHYAIPDPVHTIMMTKLRRMRLVAIVAQMEELKNKCKILMGRTSG
jgi:hypothetical protein